jgi:hypothetical protein
MAPQDHVVWSAVENMLRGAVLTNQTTQYVCVWGGLRGGALSNIPAFKYPTSAWQYILATLQKQALGHQQPLPAGWAHFGCERAAMHERETWVVGHQRPMLDTGCLKTKKCSSEPTNCLGLLGTRNMGCWAFSSEPTNLGLVLLHQSRDPALHLLVKLRPRRLFPPLPSKPTGRCHLKE